MKKVISVLFAMVFVAGLAFAADDAAKKDDTSKAPVVSAAAEVTKGTVDTVATGVEKVHERRQERREAVLDAVTGKDKE